MNDRLTWVGPLGGILAAVFYVLSRSFGGWHIPGALDVRPEDGPDVVGPLLADNADGFRVGAHLGFLSALFLMVFAADLRRRMVTHEEKDSTWGFLAFGGGLVLATVLIMQNSLTLAARVVGDQGLSPELGQLILALQWSGSDLMAAPIAAIVLGVSVMGISGDFIVRLWAWVGIVLTAGVVVALLIPGSSPLFIFVGLSLLWMTIVAGVLLWDDVRPRFVKQHPAGVSS